MKDLPAGFVWHQHRVSYGETDAMGVVYYANYLHLFERSRNEIIRASGMSYAEVERRGIFLPVRQADCRYRVPLRYDDLAWIKGGISEWGRASVTPVAIAHAYQFGCAVKGYLKAILVDPVQLPVIGHPIISQFSESLYPMHKTLQSCRKV